MSSSVEMMDIKFGYTCNNDCIHCVVAGHKERLLRQGLHFDRTAEEIEEHLRDAKRLGVSTVVFTGGEVTIRKDFIDMLNLAKKLGLSVSLQTNGRMFRSKDFTSEVIRTGACKHFEIAVHSSKPEIHDQITRVKGSFRQTLGGIENLLELGNGNLKINIKVVLSRLNFRDISGIVALAKQIGVRRVDVSFPHGMGNALKYWHEIVPRYSEISEYILEAVRLGDKLGVLVTFEAVPFCFLSGYEYCATEIDLLRQRNRGATSLLRQVGDQERNWQEGRLSIKSKAKQCVKCRFFGICEGVWEEYLRLYGSDEFVPVRGDKIVSLEELFNKSKGKLG